MNHNLLYHSSFISFTNAPNSPIYPGWKCIPLFELCTKRRQKSLGNRQRQDKSKDRGCRLAGLPLLALLLSLLTSQPLLSRLCCASSAFRCMFWGYRYQGNKIIATISVSLFICVTARGEQFVSRSHDWQGEGELGGFGDDSIDCRGGAGCFLAPMLIQLCALVSWMPF